MGDTVFWEGWRSQLTALIDGFGVEHTYLTEFGPSTISLASYSTDETEQATAVYMMLKFIQDSGITRADYYQFFGDDFGALTYTTPHYRELWGVLVGRIISGIRTVSGARTAAAHTTAATRTAI